MYTTTYIMAISNQFCVIIAKNVGLYVGGLYSGEGLVFRNGVRIIKCGGLIFWGAYIRRGALRHIYIYI